MLLFPAQPCHAGTALHGHVLLPQVMPVHATRSLPGSEHITSNVPQLMASFDPAKPLTFEVGC